MPEGTRRKHGHSLILKTTRALPEIASNCRQQSTVMNLTILRGVMLIFCFVVLSGLNINRYLFETRKFSILLTPLSLFLLLFNFQTIFLDSMTINIFLFQYLTIRYCDLPIPSYGFEYFEE